MSRYLVLLLITVLLVSCATAPRNAGYRGGPSRTGVLGERDITALPQPLWLYKTGDALFAAPLVDDGRVYLPCADGYMRCLDAANGDLLWSFYTLDEINSTPAVAHGMVFFGSWNGYVYGLDAYTGAQIWRHKTEFLVDSSPLVLGDIVYIGGDDGHLYALDAHTGEVTHAFEAQDAVTASPTLANNAIVFGSVDGHVYFIDGDCAKLAAYDTGAPLTGAPAAAGDLIIAKGAGKLYALSVNSDMQVTELWRCELDFFSTNPTLWRDRVFAGSFDGCAMYALDITTGEQAWRFQTGGSVFSDPVVSGGTVCFGSRDGFVYALNATDGAPVWRIPVEGGVEASPIIAGDLLLIAGLNGILYVYQLQ